MRITPENVSEIIAQVRADKPKPSFRLSNLPIVNLLCSFLSFYNSAHEPKWLLALENFEKHPARAPLSRDNYLTHAVISVVTGFETYVKYGIWMTCAIAGLNWKKRLEKLPRGASGSAVDYLFNRLPAELLPDFAIHRADPEAEAFYRDFYKGVRNPLVHGGELSNASAYDFLCLLEWYRRGYEWVASWKTVEIYVEAKGNQLGLKETRLNSEAGRQRVYEFRMRRQSDLVSKQ